MFPLAFGIIRDEFPRERVAGGIALISGLLGIGGGLGIVLAGPILDNLGYHWLFWIPCVVIVATAVATMFVIPESPIRAPGSVDWLGAALLSLLLVCLLLAISEAPQWGWTSVRTIGLLAVAAVAGAAWVVIEARTTNALVDMQMMRLRPVWSTNLAGLPDRLRSVQRVRTHPSVRPDPALERLWLRLVRHPIGPVSSPVDADDVDRCPV